MNLKLTGLGLHVGASRSHCLFVCWVGDCQNLQHLREPFFWGAPQLDVNTISSQVLMSRGPVRGCWNVLCPTVRCSSLCVRGRAITGLYYVSDCFFLLVRWQSAVDVVPVRPNSSRLHGWILLHCQLAVHSCQRMPRRSAVRLGVRHGGTA